MAKRKRQAVAQSEPAPGPVSNKKAKAVQPPKEKASKEKTTTPAVSTTTTTSTAPETIQIVVGSYDRILHGLTVTIGPKDQADFADTFLFNAHTSAIRCVATSPVSAPVAGQTQNVMLASGSTDERINLYSLSAHPPSRRDQDLLAKVAPRPILENPKNREIGTLLHHSSTVTALRFPNRSKLLSSSEDSTIAVTRTRDWSLLSNIKAPIPKPQGRPSGDTAPLGGTPSGVNDFAIHPSMKLMISVSKGERAMRLWNLVTGKKAGVLNFSREMLQEAGEGKHSTGEGRRVVWGNVDDADEFAVGFDRDIVVFGMDSVPKCRVMGSIRSKIHQFSYVQVDEEADVTLLAAATEDGRILFFSTKEEDLTKPDDADDKKSESLPTAKLVGRSVARQMEWMGESRTLLLSRARQIRRELDELQGKKKKKQAKKDDEAAASGVGKLLGTYETRNRITCMTAFLMIPRPEGVEESEYEFSDEEEDEEEESDSDED
ncbi:hypothetical protein CDV31_001448 [Fusarium ambrosium]|uniref:Protein MAK11 n=1 Tax=Fusarium ambrosium TaxID=131363 RepID=A0A428V006_9HYPO|nr:hypothetical protein CDV31_001448 [Fusarium ambrosium]